MNDGDNSVPASDVPTPMSPTSPAEATKPVGNSEKSEPLPNVELTRKLSTTKHHNDGLDVNVTTLGSSSNDKQSQDPQV